MIGSIRTALALILICGATLIVVPLQYLALKTRLFSREVLPRFWHRAMVRALGLRVHLRGRMTADRPLLIASNHISWTDIMVVGSLADVTFIARSDLAGWPIIGALSRLQRTVFVERHRKGTAGDQAGQVAERLAGNDALVLFAEGTTGDGNQLLPFKSALFGAARLVLGEANVDTVYIQPMAIAYTRLHGMPMGRQHRMLASWIGDNDLLPHLKEVLREGAMDVEVEFGEPVEFTASSDRKQVTRRVENAVRAMMADTLRHRQRANGSGKQ
jgi:1-acyl-sn-glycerol-3-phosphate acyltransferase